MRYLSHIFRFGLTLLVCLFLLEVFLRTAEIAPTKYTRIDDTLGLAFRPNSDLLLLNEGFYLGGTNAEGYLGPVVSSDASRRVALLGDSYVEAFQVFERDHFASIAQQKFLDNNSPILLQNKGMSGFDLGQMYCRYRQSIAPTNPALSLFFLAPEDFAVAEQGLSPMPRLTEDGTLSISYPGERNSGIQLRQSLENNPVYTSSTFTLLSNCKKLVAEGQWPSILFDKFAASSTDKEVKEVDRGISPSLNLSLEAKAILEELKTEGIAIVVLKPYPEVLKAYLQQLGIPLIDLMPELDKLRAAGVDPQYWEATNEHGHYNQAGHQAIARSLVRDLPALVK